MKIALQSVDTSSPLVLLTTLKKLCDHTWLNFSEPNFRQAMRNPTDFPEGMETFGNVTESTKVGVARALIQSHITEGHKTLVFSLSKRLLDIVAVVLKQDRVPFSRLDGDCAQENRQGIVDRFNSGADGAQVLLLTTQVGGLGLTITAASRAILLDPSWNPAVDSQAVDRIHRLGQDKDVLVYRLVTCGTVEEKVYRNQVFKAMCARQTHASSADGDSAQQRFYRYFTHHQLRSMFCIGEVCMSETAQQLRDLHGETVPAEVGAEKLRDIPFVVDYSDHNAVFTAAIAPDKEDDTPAPKRRQRKGLTPGGRSCKKKGAKDNVPSGGEIKVGEEQQDCDRMLSFESQASQQPKISNVPLPLGPAPCGEAGLGNCEVRRSILDPVPSTGEEDAEEQMNTAREVEAAAVLFHGVVIPHLKLDQVHALRELSEEPAVVVVPGKDSGRSCSSDESPETVECRGDAEDDATTGGNAVEDVPGEDVPPLTPSGSVFLVRLCAVTRSELGVGRPRDPSFCLWKKAKSRGISSCGAENTSSTCMRARRQASNTTSRSRAPSLPPTHASGRRGNAIYDVLWANATKPALSRCCCLCSSG